MSLPHTDETSEPRSDRVNWRVNDFCKAHGIGRSLFYEEVQRGEISVSEAKAWQERKALGAR